MVAYQVSINGERVCLAGVGDSGVLSAILSRVSGPDRQPDHNFHVGGYANHEHTRWIDKDVAVGDVIQIRVIEAPQVDGPTRRAPEDPELVEKAERSYYESMRKKYGDK